MTKLLIKLFIKNPNKINDSNTRKAYGNLASFFGIISNILICILKLVFGLIFNVISLVADGVNNLTDAGNSIVSLVGFKLSNKPADKDHPFGHARIEYISGFIVSIIIVILGLQLVISSVQDIITNFNIPYEQMNQKEYIITLSILLVAIIIKIYQCIFYTKIGKKISSLTLIAASKDSRNDVIATTSVLIGLIISNTFNFYIDGYLSALVGLFIIYSGFSLVKETSNPLIGERINQDFVKKITNKILSYDGVLGVHDLQVHEYGPSNIFASIHVEVNAHNDILKTHDLIDNIEKDILNDLNVNMTIHMDPVVINDPYTEEVKKEVIPYLNKISYIHNIHDFRVIKGPTHTNIIFDVVIKDDTKKNNDEIKKELKAIVKAINPNYELVITIDHDYSNYL